MARLFWIFLLSLLSAGVSAQKHLYFRLVVEDSGKRHPVRLEDISLMDSGEEVRPVYSTQYQCLVAGISPGAFTMVVRFRNDRTLVVPGVEKSWIQGKTWTLELNPLASDSFWTLTPDVAWRFYDPSLPFARIGVCGTGRSNTADSIHLQHNMLNNPKGDEGLTCATDHNHIRVSRFLYQTQRVDYYGHSIYFAKGADNPEFLRPHNTVFTPNPNSTDIFLGPKPSEYFSLSPEQ